MHIEMTSMWTSWKKRSYQEFQNNLRQLDSIIGTICDTQ